MSAEPFVFLDKCDGNPYKAVKLRGDWWFCYWHEGQKSWVTLHKADDFVVAYYRDQALPPEQAKLYDDLHVSFRET